MIITYFGKQFFKVQHGEKVVAFNPISKNSKHNASTHFGADLALVTTNHEDYNGIENLSHGEREPFVINGPGEYEVGGIPILGSMSYVELISEKNKEKKYINTIYSLTMENINITFLGAFKSQKESLDIAETDILFIPIHDGIFLNGQEGAKLVSSLEPKIIIPMDYDEKNLKVFLKEVGQESVKPIDKLVIKKKDLENKKSEVVILSF